MQCYIERAQDVRIVLVGAGGTGGYVFYYLARLVAALRGSHSIQLMVADGDIVEEKNLVRQNFTASDVGQPKAQCLARRYGKAYGLNIYQYPNYIENIETLRMLCYGELGAVYPNITIILGCVDNNKTRQLFHQEFNRDLTWSLPLVYIDSGNDEWTGQVIMGCKANWKWLYKDRHCLPAVGYYYPDILEDKESLFPSEESCSEQMVSSPQNIATNIMAGTLMFTIVNGLLTFGTEIYGATFDARTGFCRSLYLDDIWPSDKELPFNYGALRVVK